MKARLLFFALLFCNFLSAQSYTEGSDLPSTGTGPAFTVAGSGITIAGTLNTPGDGQDRFQVIVPSGCSVTSVTYIISDTANINANGHVQFGIMNQQNFPPLSGSFASGPFGAPFPVGPGTYDCMFVANVAANDHWSVVFNTSCMTGVQEEKSTSTVNVFPNPASDEIRISRQAGKSATLELLDALGRVVLSYPLNANESTCSISTLAAGVYTYRVKAEGVLQTGKLVVQR